MRKRLTQDVERTITVGDSEGIKVLKCKNKEGE
jgi:hypothetical protein